MTRKNLITNGVCIFTLFALLGCRKNEKTIGESSFADSGERIHSQTIEERAKLGDADAQFALAVSYGIKSAAASKVADESVIEFLIRDLSGIESLDLFTNSNVQENELIALDWCRMAGDNGNPIAQLLLALSLFSTDGVECIRELEILENKGVPHAKAFGGGILVVGPRSLRDCDRGMKLITESCDVSDPIGMMFMGAAHFKGRCGLDRDTLSALSFLQKASDEGLRFADFSMGSMLLSRESTKEDREAAFQHFDRASVDVAEAYKEIRDLAVNGVEDAEIWLNKRAEYGDSAALFYAGKMYAFPSGLGDIEPDAKMGAQFLLKAAEQAYPQSFEEVGMLYEYGIGVPRNYVMAYAYYSVSETFFPMTKLERSEVYERLRDLYDDAEEAAFESKPNSEHIGVKMTKEQIAEAQKVALEILNRLE